MLINSSTIPILQRLFDAKFQSGYTRTQTRWDKFCLKEPMDGGAITYGWIDRLPKMREWVGERVFNNIAEREMTYVVKDYESSLEINRNDILDDRLRVLSPKLEMLGVSARKAPDLNLADLMQKAKTMATYDGQNFFDTDHPSNPDAPGGTATNPYNINLFASGTSYSGNSTWALSSTTYALGRAAMQSYLGADGSPLGVTPTKLIVPPQLEYTARTILNAELNAVSVGSAAATQTNVLQNTAEVVVMPELAGEAAVWYLVDDSLPIRPFLFLERQAPITTQLISPTDENVFNRKKFRYGVDARWIFAPGWYPLAARFEG